jgi:hypothetical protein
MEQEEEKQRGGKKSQMRSRFSRSSALNQPRSFGSSATKETKDCGVDGTRLNLNVF